jgi:hypothetical protein
MILDSTGSVLNKKALNPSAGNALREQLTEALRLEE